MKCSGVDTSSGRPIEIEIHQSISAVNAFSGDATSLPYLSPGWIDLQVNGFAGVDYNSPAASLDEIGRSIRALFATGVTRFYPTVITGSPENMAGALRNLAAAKAKLDEGAAIAGFHVEGPHISPEDGPRGAHPRRWVRPPDIHEFRRLQEAAGGQIRLLTLSPEWPGAARYIEALAREGVVASIGHARATSAQIREAADAGATMSTHLGNGSDNVLPRHPNYIWDQLAEDRLAAGLIVDGIHLPPAFVKVAVRAKGIERSILVTDAAPPAGAAPGRYKLGELDVELTADERVVLAGQDRLAGSSLRMNRGVANLMRLAGLKLADAIAMATVNPARVARIAGRERGLVPGDLGDMVCFRVDARTGDVTVEKTFLAGNLVYAA